MPGKLSAYNHRIGTGEELGMPEVYTLPLADPQAAIATVGGKGASLARLAAAGLPVPEGFHVTTAAYRRLVAECGMQDRIAAAVSTAAPDQPAALEEAARRIAILFTQCDIPAEIADAIRRAYAGLGGGDPPVAVRSSATAEDLPDLSFAGQQETYLNIRGEAPVLDAVKRCWTSLWTARAIIYRARNGVAHADASLAVVVQKLVPADAAGILFTANPLTGMRDRVTINAAWGLGEAVVGGRVTPDTFAVDKISGRVVERHINRKDAMTVRTPTGTSEKPVPADRRSKPSLSPAQAARLARLGLRIEKLYGQPMDIEWALAGGRFFILQARPITTLHGHNPATGEWNDSLAGDYLWTNANYGEAVPDVMTHCTWSLIKVMLDYADATIGPQSQYGNISGRLYANLSVTASFAAAFGLGPKRFADLIADGFGRLPEGVEIPIQKISILPLLQTAPTAMMEKLFRMRKNLKEMAAFLAAAPGRCEMLRGRIQSISYPGELAALWDREVAPYFIKTCQMLEAAANQGGGAILFLRRNLQKMVGPEDADALLTSSSGAQGPLSSLEPLLGLTQLANDVIDRATFARRFGHRGPHEAELSVPRPAEDPQWIDRELAGLHRSAENPEALLARQGASRRAALDRLHERFPRKEKTIRRQIESWTAIAHDREAVRSELVRSMWILRTFVLRAGELTQIGDDIFFLSIDEILALLSGQKPPLANIPARREAYARYCALPPYPGLIRGRFDPFQWAADPQRRSDLFDANAASTAPASGAIKGFPGASGIVEGRVRVITGAEAGNQLQTGEILVTVMTNVGWTPLFPRAAAVVTDVGAPLSHAAIVARELGIPAVVGCGDATMRLHTGNRVRVDGGKGLVEILEL
jgi:phosphohistidine swiveling domain-containing protein